MTWVAVAVGVGTAAASAYGAHQANQAASRANRGAGSVDITHTTDPWEPSRWQRQTIMEQGQHLYQTSGDRWGDGPPGYAQLTSGMGGGGAGGGGGKGRGRKGKGKGGGGGQGNVNSAQSQRLSLELQNRAEGGSPLYDPANDYTIDTLNGQDHNGYRSTTNDEVQRWIKMLFDGEDLGGGTGGGFGSGGGYPGGGGGYSFNYQGGGTADAPVGAAKYAKEILDGKYLKPGNPFQSALLDSMTKRIRDEFNSTTLPGINSEIGGAGAVGSEAMNDAYRRASQGFTDSLAGAVNGVQYTDYNNRMEDVMHALDTGAGLDENAADNAARAAAASASAGASAYGADRQAQLQYKLARMSALQDALGLSSGIASDYSGDQRNALNDVPELSGLDLRDLSAAFGASHSMDDLAEQERQSGRSAGIARAGLNLQRQQQAFNQWQYMQQAPYQQLGSWADLVNAMSSGYGSSTESGIDRRNASPMPYINPWQQAIAGGMAGYGMASQWGGGSAQPGGSGYSSYGYAGGYR